MVCGIAGTIDAMADRAAAIVSQLNDAQKHRGPDHEVITRVGCITLGDTWLAIREPKRGFHLPMERWLAGPLAPLVMAASEPGAPVWSLVDRTKATRAGLASGRPRRRWAETWALTALNAWRETWPGSPA
jgi:hypothetical protein